MRYQITTKSGDIINRTLYEQVDAYASNIRSLKNLGSHDVIHAHDWLTFKAAMEAKRITGLPLFVHIHATEYDRAGASHGNPLIREIEYIGLHTADHVFAVSNRTKQILIQEYSVPADKISVAHNVMEVLPEHLMEQDETYVYLQKLRSLGYGVVVNAGRMTIQKGVYNLVKAARLVIDANPRTIFLFVGGGEQIPELLELAADMGMAGNIIFTGRVEGVGREWRDSFRTADLYVMPSVSEPAGMVPFEAIAYGAPTLISKQSGTSEFLINTLKVDHWNIEDMANQICSVLSNRNLHDVLLANAQEEHRQMSWGPTSMHVMDKYSLALKRRKAVMA